MKVFVLVGKSGSGKTTIEQEVLKRNKNVISCVSSTTRPMRATETGNEYNFLSEVEFLNQQANGEFLETRVYNTAHGIWYYGLPKSAVKENKKYLVVLDTKGLQQLIEYVVLNGGKESDVISIYINAKRETRYKRYIERDDLTEEKRLELERRFIADDEQINQAACCMVLRNEEEYELENCIWFVDNLINRFEL